MNRNLAYSEEVLLCIPYDISKNDTYTDGEVRITKTKLTVAENGIIKKIYPVSELSDIYPVEYCGCGALEYEYGGKCYQIVRYSLDYSEAYTSAAEIIKDINSGLDVGKITIDSNNLCPICKTPYIRNTKICPKCTDKFSIIKRLWILTKPCRTLYMILLLFFWINSAVTVITPILSKHLVNDVLTYAGANVGRLLFIVSLMLLCSIITLLMEALRSGVSAKSSNLLVRDLRNEIYTHIQNLELSFVERKKTGDLMQRINSDTKTIQSFIQDIGIMAVNEICLFIAIAVVTFSINVKMALLIFVPMPIAAIIINRIRTVIKRRYRRQWRKMDILTSRLNDCLNGIKVVKVFGRENDEIQRFRKSAETVRDITSTNEKYVYTIFPIIRFIMGFGSFLVLLYGGSCVIGGNLSVGELVQFSSYGSYLYSKIEWFSMLPRHVSISVASMQRICEILDEKETVITKTKKNTDEIQGKFEFKDLSFGYRNHVHVLKNINETVFPGEMIGIVGHSGAGKSTLINLIMKLYSPSRGDLFLDKIPLEKYDDMKYKENLGVVLQESYLFSGSIIDNIMYACPNANIEDCIEAAKIANAHDFIMELPDAYNTQVGEKGSKLSGGQRQRIAIARAILSGPKILILDEATASVDSETEEKIQNSLSVITKGRTVFAIAHRLSTLKSADRLIVLDHGRIAEEGTHGELIRKNGIYAALLQAQSEMIKGSVTIDNIEEKAGKKHKREVSYKEYERDGVK